MLIYVLLASFLLLSAMGYRWSEFATRGSQTLASVLRPSYGEKATNRKRQLKERCIAMRYKSQRRAQSDIANMRSALTESNKNGKSDMNRPSFTV